MTNTGNMTRRFPIFACAVGAAFVMSTAACGTAATDGAPGATKSSAATTTSTAASPAASGGLTPFQIEHGVGPITTAVHLSATVDKKMVQEGGEVFEQKCAACHKMAERYVGPALGDVIKRSGSHLRDEHGAEPAGHGGEPSRNEEAPRRVLRRRCPTRTSRRAEARQVVEYLRTQKHLKRVASGFIR